MSKNTAKLVLAHNNIEYITDEINTVLEKAGVESEFNMSDSGVLTIDLAKSENKDLVLAYIETYLSTMFDGSQVMAFDTSSEENNSIAIGLYTNAEFVELASSEEEEEEEDDDDEFSFDEDGEEEIEKRNPDEDEEEDSDDALEAGAKQKVPKFKNQQIVQDKPKRRGMSVLTADTDSKMAMNFYRRSCGPNNKLYPEFLMELDALCSDFRKSSGYIPEDEDETQQQAQTQPQQNMSSEESLLELADSLLIATNLNNIELAKKENKNKFKEGRRGLLSAIMPALSGEFGKKMESQWNSGDVEGIMESMGTVTEKTIDRLLETHPNPKMPEETEEEKTEEVNE
jgi:hypothetical protein